MILWLKLSVVLVGWQVSTAQSSSTTSSATSSSAGSSDGGGDFESLVLMRLRQAEERKRLAREMADDHH